LDQTLLRRFLAFSPSALDYYSELDKRQLNAKVHVRKIVALAEIHGEDAVSKAIEDALKSSRYWERLHRQHP
jgi:hypothetical protein